MNPLCIYHGNCADGFAAAWVVRRALGIGNVDFHGGVYQDPPPDVEGRDVIMVDFSYKRPVLDRLASAARSILIIDHHKTAAEDLADFGRPPPWPRWRAGAMAGEMCQSLGVAALFDMESSGASLAWQYFFPEEPSPQLIRHIEDRDLWRFALPGTREIQACVFSFPYDFAIWDNLMNADMGGLRKQGEAIERKHHKDIAELVGVCRRLIRIGGHIVPAASLPYTLTADAGHLMAQGEAFAACYWDTPEGRVFSLRSTPDGLDVSAVAVTYGGGGHRAAAGFRVPLARIPEFEL